jgi:2-polyprenyl-6-methoxyphenol hydroxylase-like FAD-dependent oxidoreductase
MNVQPNPIRTVLISGASVAGPALAFWLSRLGFTPTIVEKAPSLREGGYAVDFRGTSMEVLRRMGLLEAVQAKATNMGDMFYVDRRGRKQARLPAAAFSGELEIMRGDLAQLLYDATWEGTEYIFGDSVAELVERPDHVEVHFESGLVRRFDIAVGADGIHSNIRAKAFGPEADYVESLGLAATIFSVPNRLNLDYSGHLLPAPGTLAGVYSARDNTEARAMLWFSTADTPLPRDRAAQKRLIREKFTGQGWQVPAMLSDMETAPDFYFDEVAQVVMDRWSRGRVVLLGDAAHCASPLSGMGTGMAVTGAYILAHELAAHRDDPTAAFAAYETRQRPFSNAAQALAQKAKGGFVPKSSWTMLVSSLLMKLLPFMPAEVILKEIHGVATAVTV